MATLSERPPGVNTVRVVVDTNAPDGVLLLNGVHVGYTPKEIHVEVDDERRALYDVNITVRFSSGAGRLGGVGPRQNQGGTYTYRQGDRLPKTVYIMGNRVRQESRETAPWDTKPEVTSVRRPDAASQMAAPP